MSKNVKEQDLRPVLRNDDPEARKYSTELTIAGPDEVVSYCDEQGWPVSRNLVRRDTASGQLPSYRLDGLTRRYAPRDIYLWVQSKRRTAASVQAGVRA